MLSLVFWMLLLLLAPGAADAEKLYLKLGPPTSAPIGHVKFCGSHPQDCLPNGKSSVHLTPTLYAALAEAQGTVNSQIQPMTDLEMYGKNEFWSYPKSGKGDCEDYVLLKRKRLIERGWPGSALRLTMVRLRRSSQSLTASNSTEKHLVLAAVTDQGIFILDNMRSGIKEWHSTPYSYVKWTSASNPRLWVKLVDDRVLSR